jgi:GDP-L-fucose synthase
LAFDNSKPDGTLRKLMDVSKINTMGWKHHIALEFGIHDVYDNFKQNSQVAYR